MVEVNPSDHCNDRLDKRPVEKPAPNSLEGTPEGQQVRNATGDQVEAIKAANPNAHDGSATPKDKIKAWQEQNQALIEEQSKSLELFEDDKLIAARVMEVTRPAVIAKENIEQQSKTVEELTRLAKVNPVYAPILGLRQHAESLPPGQEKDKFVQLAKDQAAETKGQFREPENQSEDQEACGSHTVPPQKLITVGQHNYSSTDLLAYDNQQSGTVTDATAEKALSVDKLDKRPIYDYGWGFKSDIPSMAETGVEYRVGFKTPEITEQALHERVASLPLHQQAQILHAGIQAYHQELNHQSFRMVVGHITGVGESVVGMSQGADSLGKSICDVAQFSQDIAENNPRAQDTATEAGHSFGKLLVGGFKVVAVADNYLGSIGAASYEGDNTKAFRDISVLGQRMNQRWAEMSTEEKSKFTTKLTLDNLGPIAAAGVGAKLAKSINVTGALQDLGASVSVFGAKEREKYSQVIGKIAEKLTVQPMGVTPDGRLMPIPRQLIKKDSSVLMSKADDISGQSGIGKKFYELKEAPLGKDGKPINFKHSDHLELTHAQGDVSDSSWTGANFLTGWKVEGSLKDEFMVVGEALPKSFPTVDGWASANGRVTSIKSIDLRAQTYQNIEEFEKKVRGYLEELEAYDGVEQAIQGIKIEPERIRGKVLHLGVPNGAMTRGQKDVFEKLANELQSKGSDSRIKVTALR